MLRRRDPAAAPRSSSRGAIVQSWHIVGERSRSWALPLFRAKADVDRALAEHTTSPPKFVSCTASKICAFPFQTREVGGFQRPLGPRTGHVFSPGTLGPRMCQRLRSIASADDRFTRPCPRSSVGSAETSEKTDVVPCDHYRPQGQDTVRANLFPASVRSNSRRQ